MLCILSIFGTRPEAIKMAPIVKALEADISSFKSVVCVTGQHRSMLDQVLDVFGIIPEYDLDIMTAGQDLFDITSSVLLGLKEILARVKPDLVLVHGDTTTTMAAALAAYYCRIPVGHVEAGLRTRNKYSPFPEEVNRRVAGVLADLHFAATDEARKNLLEEGVDETDIFVVGNTVVDAVEHARSVIHSDRTMLNKMAERFSFLNPDKRMILVTGHRRENFGADLEQICLALKDIARSRPDVEMVYPVHLNPNVRDAVYKIIGNSHPAIHLIEPADYLSFIYLMECSYIILTDSGGIQEEAPTLGRPVLVMRSTTERPEAIEAGTAKLVGTGRSAIVKEVLHLLEDENDYRSMATKNNPYGDGMTARRIAGILKQRTGKLPGAASIS